MKDIKVVDSDSNSRILVIEENATLSDICSSDFVTELFDAEVSDICENLSQMNGMDIPKDSGFRNCTFECVPADKTVLAFDLEIAQSDVNDDAEQPIDASQVEVRPASAAAEPHLPGIVLVNTSGGLRSTAVDIISGETTISQAIHDPAVLRRSGMTEAMLSNQNVRLNDESIPDTVIDSKTLKDGDTVTLSPRFAHSKAL